MTDSQKKYLIVGSATAAVIALIMLVLTLVVFIPQSVISQGNTREADLNAVYADGANFLSNCVVKTKQAANVANAQTNALDKVLKDAVAGRYGTGNTMDQAKLFSAIQEAYPDTSGLSKTFQNVLATITGCQDDFRNKQTVVLDRVRSFRTWKTGGFNVRTFGGSNFPNENLVISLPGLNLTGTAALTKMSTPIVDGTTADAYQSGNQSTDNPFGDTSK